MVYTVKGLVAISPLVPGRISASAAKFLDASTSNFGRFGDITLVASAN